MFTLDEEKVFKSEVVKKTLSPKWDESFECQIPSRVASKFTVEIFDVRSTLRSFVLIVG